jgi:NitT/TauT family transport system ATP-binding protein
MEAAYLGERVMVLAANPGRIHAVHDMRPIKTSGGIRREQPEMVEAMAGLRRELERC